MGFTSKDPVYGKLAARLKSCSIDIGQFIDENRRDSKGNVGFDGTPWPSNPIGFNFFAKSPNQLINVLTQSASFGVCTFRKDTKPGFTSFRQVSKDGSLHIHVAQGTGSSICHLDSVSIVKGKAQDNSVIYNLDPNRLLSHYCVDLKHMTPAMDAWPF